MVRKKFWQKITFAFEWFGFVLLNGPYRHIKEQLGKPQKSYFLNGNAVKALPSSPWAPQLEFWFIFLQKFGLINENNWMVESVFKNKFSLLVKSVQNFALLQQQKIILAEIFNLFFAKKASEISHFCENYCSKYRIFHIVFGDKRVQ